MQAFQGILDRLPMRLIATRVLCKNPIRNFAQAGHTKSKVPEPVASKAITPESERMKKFHEKLKLEPLQRVSPGVRYVDLLLVETDPKSGEVISNSEQDPTKWGDWQNGGRVSDF